MVTRMPGEDVVPHKGFLPLKETAFLSPRQVDVLVHPKNLNSGALHSIYRNIESDEVPEPEVHEVFFRDADSNSVVREIVFVDPLYSHKRPRMLVSVDAVRAMHQGIAIMARKVDKLLATLCNCREDFWKDLINLREQVVASHHMDDMGPHLAMWFHPPRYQDTLSMELLEQRVTEIRDEWGEMYRQKESELNLLKANIGKDGGGSSDPKKMLAKMAKVIPLEHLMVIVRNAAPNAESFYTALERLLAQRKRKQRRDEKPKEDKAEVVTSKEEKTDGKAEGEMVEAFLQSDFKRFQKEHDRVMAAMGKMRRREEDLIKKHEDALIKVNDELDESKEQFQEAKEKLDANAAKVKQLEKELAAEKSIWAQAPVGGKPGSPKRHTKKTMTVLATRLDGLSDDSLRVLAQSFEDSTRLSLAEECVMAMGAPQQESIMTTLRCCQMGGSASPSHQDDMSHESPSMASPSHSQMGSVYNMSRSHSQMDKESVCHSAVSSPRSHFQDISQFDGQEEQPRLSLRSRSESHGSLANKSETSALFDEEDDDDACPSISERTWRHLLDSCADHKKHFPDMRRRESMMSQPFSLSQWPSSERSSIFSTYQSDNESTHPHSSDPGAVRESRRDGSKTPRSPRVPSACPEDADLGDSCARSSAPVARSEAIRAAASGAFPGRESHYSSSSRAPRKSPRTMASPRNKRLFLDSAAQTDDVGNDSVIRMLRADLMRANEYMPSLAHQKVIKRIVERTKIIKEKIFVDSRTMHECVPTPFFPTLCNVKAKLWSHATQTEALEDGKSSVTVKPTELTPRVGILQQKPPQDTAILGFRQSLRMKLNHLSTQSDFGESAPSKDEGPGDDGSASDQSDEATAAVPPPSPCAVLFSPGGSARSALAPPLLGAGAPPPSPTPAGANSAEGTQSAAALKRPLLAVTNGPGVGLLPQPPPPSPQPEDSSSEPPSASTTRRSTRTWEPSLPDTKEETAASVSAQEAGHHVASDDNCMTALRRKSSLLVQTSTTKLELPPGRRASQSRRSITDFSDLASGGDIYPRHPPLYEGHNEQDLPLVPEDQIAESPVDTNSSSYNDRKDCSPGNSAWTSRQTSRVNSPRSMFTSRNTSAFTSRRTSVSDSNFASRRVSVLFGEESHSTPQTAQQRLIEARRPSVVLSIPPVFDAPNSPEGGHVFDIIMLDADIQTEVSVQAASKALFDEEMEAAPVEVEFSVGTEFVEVQSELQQLCMNFLLSADPTVLEGFIQTIGYAFPQQSIKRRSDHDTSSTSGSDGTGSSSEESGTHRIWAAPNMDPLQMAKSLMAENSPLLRRRRAIGLANVAHQLRKRESKRATRVAFEGVASRRSTVAQRRPRQTILEDMAYSPLAASKADPSNAGKETVWGFQPLPPRVVRKSMAYRRASRAPRVTYAIKAATSDTDAEDSAVDVGRETIMDADAVDITAAAVCEEGLRLELTRGGARPKSIQRARMTTAVTPVVVQQTVVTRESHANYSGLERLFRHRDTLRQVSLERKKSSVRAAATMHAFAGNPKLHSRVRKRLKSVKNRQNVEVLRVEIQRKDSA